MRNFLLRQYYKLRAFRFYRWYYGMRTLPSYVSRMNRCVDVENVLLAVANGKREPLTREQCRELAFRLAGVSEGFK